MIEVTDFLKRRINVKQYMRSVSSWRTENIYQDLGIVLNNILNTYKHTYKNCQISSQARSNTCRYNLLLSSTNHTYIPTVYAGPPRKRAPTHLIPSQARPDTCRYNLLSYLRTIQSTKEDSFNSFKQKVFTGHALTDGPTPSL